MEMTITGRSIGSLAMPSVSAQTTLATFQSFRRLDSTYQEGELPFCHGGPQQEQVLVHLVHTEDHVTNKGKSSDDVDLLTEPLRWFRWAAW